MQLQDLVAIDISEELYKQYLQDWPLIGKFFHAEACASHLFLGNAEDAAKLPPDFLRKVEKEEDAHVLQGKPAYAHSLQILCGLKEKNRLGESSQTDTMKGRWQRHQREHDVDPEFQTIVNNLFKDSTCIRGTFLEGKMKAESREPAVIARGMTDMRRSNMRLGQGAKVLLVADSIEHVQTVAMVLGQHVSEILITHPDADKQEQLSNLVRRLGSGNRIESKMEVICWDDAMELGIANAEHVFVDRSMVMGEAASERLADAWRSHRQEGGRFVMLSDDKATRSYAMQKGPEIPGLISPGMIQAARDEYREYNLEQVANAERATYNCASSRKEKLNPRKDILGAEPNEYKILMRIRGPIMDNVVRSLARA